MPQEISLLVARAVEQQRFLTMLQMEQRLGLRSKKLRKTIHWRLQVEEGCKKKL